MEKTLVEKIVKYAHSKAYGQLIIGILVNNGITDMDILMSKSPAELAGIKGIGNKSFSILEAIRSEERKARKVKASEEPQTLSGWMEQIGVSKLQAHNLEHVLKVNGIDTIDIFMQTDDSVIAQMKGIGPWRMNCVTLTKRAIERSQKKKKRK